MIRNVDLPNRLSEKMRGQETAFAVRGLLTSDDKVLPLGADTKVLSKAFELMIRPLILEVAGESGLSVFESVQQNFYPDFTLMRDESDTQKIAVDIKSTYRHFRSSGEWTAQFTLGSYTSFLRLPTKNIAFPYDQYSRHYIVGFIYTRVDTPSEQMFSLAQRESAVCPYKDVEWFIQEKHRIAGTRAGSGNTTNIGSITGSSAEEFATGDGPFSTLGESTFLDYWRNYERSSRQRPFSNLAEYLAWKQQAEA